MKKIFASDYDGTLYLNETVSRTDLEAIHDLRGKGHYFGLCSGRHLDSLLEEVDRYEIPFDFLVGNNGSAIMNQSREVLKIHTMDLENVIALREFFRKELSLEVYFLAVNNGFTFGNEIYQTGSTFMLNHTNTFDEFLSDNVSILFSEAIDPRNTQAIVKKLQERFPHLYIFNNQPFIDITQEYVVKTNGLKHIADYFKVSYSSVSVIGDSYNDIQMIQAFDGYVMRSGEKLIKKASTKHVNSVSEAIEDVLKD